MYRLYIGSIVLSINPISHTEFLEIRDKIHSVYFK